MLGVTSSLAIENVIKDALDKGRQVFIVGAGGQIKRRLEKFGIVQLLPPHHITATRIEALQQAVTLISVESDDVKDIVNPTPGGMRMQSS
jgi:SulP family sulfate permease